MYNRADNTCLVMNAVVHLVQPDILFQHLCKDLTVQCKRSHDAWADIAAQLWSCRHVKSTCLAAQHAPQHRTTSVPRDCPVALLSCMEYHKGRLSVI